MNNCSHCEHWAHGDSVSIVNSVDSVNRCGHCGLVCTGLCLVTGSMGSRAWFYRESDGKLGFERFRPLEAILVVLLVWCSDWLWSCC